MNVRTPSPSRPSRYAPSDTTAQNGSVGMMSFWIFAGRIEGIGELSVRRGRRRRRYAWKLVLVEWATQRSPMYRRRQEGEGYCLGGARHCVRAADASGYEVQHPMVNCEISSRTGWKCGLFRPSTLTGGLHLRQVAASPAVVFLPHVTQPCPLPPLQVSQGLAVVLAGIPRYFRWVIKKAEVD